MRSSNQGRGNSEGSGGRRRARPSSTRKRPPTGGARPLRKKASDEEPRRDERSGERSGPRPYSRARGTEQRERAAQRSDQPSRKESGSASGPRRERYSEDRKPRLGARSSLKESRGARSTEPRPERSPRGPRKEIRPIRSVASLAKKSGSTEVRLQKFLAECGVGSRRKTEKMIVEGRVQVNGKVVTELGSKVNPYVDRVDVNRRPVKPAPKGIMLLNKPRGVVSTLDDPEGRPTVADFLTKLYRSYFPVGRLDWDSTGLMILTNDGDLAELLMHPRYQFDRVYHARVEGSVSDEVLQKLERGVKLRDGIAKGVARVVDNNDATTWVEVRVREGRNRLVRRMFDEIGHPVVKLKRVGYGPFKLGKLDVGQVRHLTEKEYEQVRRKVLSDAGAPRVELSAEAMEQEREVKKHAKKRVRTRWSEG